MELEDSGFPLLRDIIVTSDVKVAMDQANWIILVGAAPRQQGMERGDLVKLNASIFSEQGRAINEMAAENTKVLVMSNVLVIQLP